MRNQLTLALMLITSVGFAQTFATNSNGKSNAICLERGHSATYTKATTPNRAPYAIDTKDSTVMVYPISNNTTGKCSRCGADIDSYDKDIRITTWRRVEKKPELNPSSAVGYINWGVNKHRGLNLPFKSTTLNDDPRVASLRNDTLYIYKRIGPFASIREQIRSKKDTVVYYKDKAIYFKTAVYDKAIAFKGKNGKDIY